MCYNLFTIKRRQETSSMTLQQPTNGKVLKLERWRFFYCQGSFVGPFFFLFLEIKGGIFMLMDVYYESYGREVNGVIDNGKHYMPYGVKIPEETEREAFKSFLLSEGFTCVSWNSIYPIVLINLELKRFGLNYLPVTHRCVEDKLRTVTEFLTEIY